MSRPPAILQVLPALASGGVERGTVEIAEAIAAAGFRALVASAGGALAAEVERVGGVHVPLPLAGKSPLTIWRNAAALAALARREEVAILHARSRAPAWSAWLAARRSGAHFVTTYHGDYSAGFPGKRLYNSVMVRGERVIAVSRHIAEVIAAQYALPPGRLRIIPRGVDTALFDPEAVPAAEVAAMRAAWGAPPGRPVILLPGRMTRLKGHAVLVEALARLGGEAVAVLLGGGGTEAYRAELATLARQRGVAERLRLPGHSAAMPAALLAADIVVQTSTEREAFGRTVVEAQAMRRPVIASDIGGLPESIAPGLTGWLVPPGDPVALADAIRAVLALPQAARAEVGQAARAAVRRDRTVAAMQAATIALYRELLA